MLSSQAVASGDRNLVTMDNMYDLRANGFTGTGSCANVLPHMECGSSPLGLGKTPDQLSPLEVAAAIGTMEGG
jgi:hypothetical protein